MPHDSNLRGATPSHVTKLEARKKLKELTSKRGRDGHENAREVVAKEFCQV
jgi:hypothetical protein